MRNFKLKTLAAAVTLAASTMASASPIPVEGLFFSATNGNNAAISTIVINLLETTAQFRASPNTSRALSGASLVTLTQWLNEQGGNLSTLRWNVTGASLGDAFSSPPSPLHGGLSTSTDIETVAGSGSFNGLDDAVNNYTIFRTQKANPNLVGSTDAFFAANDNQFFSARNNGGVDIQTLGGLGQSLSFYAFFADQGGSEFFEGDFSKFSGTWKLDFKNGAASLGYSAVPVPAAVWLLGSAVIGMAGVGRRRAV